VTVEKALISVRSRIVRRAYVGKLNDLFAFAAFSSLFLWKDTRSATLTT
jgi:hypothetical protein